MVIKFFLVMLAIAIVDVFWTWFIQFSSDRKALKAAAASTMIMIIGAFATTSYVHDKILIIAAALGAFIGTYLTVKFTKKSEPAEVKPTLSSFHLPYQILAGFDFPENPVEGLQFYNATLGSCYVFDGLTWVKFNPNDTTPS